MPVYLPALVQPDPTQPVSLPVQLFTALSAAIRSGRIAKGGELPSTRQAAEMLCLSRSSVTTAYDLLRAEGMIHMHAGRRPIAQFSPRPAAHAPATIGLALSTRGQNMQHDLRAESYLCPDGRLAPGLPDECLFPADLWAQTLRRVARRQHGDEAGYGGYHGALALREAICARLASDRGLTVSPEQILVTTGTQATLTLLTQMMTDPGDDVAMEDPGYLGARASFMAAGARICAVPVDDQGMQVALLPQTARLIYITPSNQYPLGGRMGLARRLALLEMARAQGALILEDDYDSEFLWHGREIASLAAHGTGTECAYLGSASKTLLPGLRLGWVAVPESMIGAVRAAHRTAGIAANLHGQLALASLMNSGQYRAHLRRISRLYQQRGLALFHALSGIDGVRLLPPHGGVQLGISLERPSHEAACQKALTLAGYRVARLSASCLQAPHKGLIIGFATLRADDPERIATVLRAVLAS